MVFSKLKLFNLILLVVLLNIELLNAQTKKIILDIKTEIPISLVNIYTKNDKGVLGVTSNNEGIFLLDFLFNELIFKHLNYEDAIIKKEDLKDTVFLNPKENRLPEFTVRGTQKPWITILMQEVVKQKKDNYSSNNSFFKYNYNTYSLSDSNGYAFKSIGSLRASNVLKNDDFAINPEIGVIKYKDTTAGCDFRSLQKILYEDKFIKEFDKNFIKDYIFDKNSDSKNQKPYIITFNFSSKKYKDDKGLLTIDTISKAIIAYRRVTGTDYNIKAHTNFIYRNFASMAMGASYKEMQSEIYVKYIQYKNKYVLSESYIKDNIRYIRKKKGKEYTTFSAHEAELVLNPIDSSIDNQWIILPKPFYIGIETKKDRLSYDALQRISKKYLDFSLLKD